MKELTRRVASHLSSPESPLFIHGIDVDSELIARAKEASIPESADAKFHHIDFMTERAEEELGSLLEGPGNSTEKPFDIIFCFSVTMWIHLNHGDEGMDAFFRKISRLSDLVLLEPQPWKCYRTAARRMRKLGQPEFEHLKVLEETIEGAGTRVEEHLLKMCLKHGLRPVEQYGETDWKRKLVLLKKSWG